MGPFPQEARLHVNPEPLLTRVEENMLKKILCDAHTMQCVSISPIDEGGDAVRLYGANKAALMCVPEGRGLVCHQYIFKIGITCSVLLCFFNEPQGCSYE